MGRSYHLYFYAIPINHARPLGWEEVGATFAGAVEKREQVVQITRELTDADAEINDRVYRLFNLTADEIALLQREVEH